MGMESKVEKTDKSVAKYKSKKRSGFPGSLETMDTRRKFWNSNLKSKLFGMLKFAMGNLNEV